MTPFRIFWLLLAAMALSACASDPQAEEAPPSPALWEVTAPGGEKGWLFGTAHVLPRGATWRTELFDRALAEIGEILVEIDLRMDNAERAAILGRMSQSPGLPAIEERVAPGKAGALDEMIARHGLSPQDFAQTETWAVALVLSNAAMPADFVPGADRYILGQAGDRPVVELEGLEAQLGVFDRLPETRQAELLEAIVEEAASGEDRRRAIVEMWRTGDAEALAESTETRLRASPELRQALLVDRNHSWIGPIEAALARGRRPFVAVGAAHMTGADGIVALLEAKGYRIARLQ